MKICKTNHREICHVGDICPLCSYMKENSFNKNELNKLEAKIKTLEEENFYLTFNPIQAIVDGKMQMPLGFYRETITREARFNYTYKRQC